MGGGALALFEEEGPPQKSVPPTMPSRPLGEILHCLKLSALGLFHIRLGFPNSTFYYPELYLLPHSSLNQQDHYWAALKNEFKFCIDLSVGRTVPTFLGFERRKKTPKFNAEKSRRTH